MPIGNALKELFQPARRDRTVQVIGAVFVALLALSAFVRFVTTVRAMRECRATGPSWSFPSRVYSDGLSLVRGRPMPPEYLRAHLEARGYGSAAAASRPGSYKENAAGFEIFLRGFAAAPDPEGHGGPERVAVSLARGRIAGVRRLGGRTGSPAPDTEHPPRLEPLLIATFSDSQHVHRTWVPLAHVPQVVRDAIIAAEDRRFYSHVGLDLRSNARAMVANARAGGVRQGASTITQQLARGLFLGRELTWLRKVREAFVAAGLEILLSKEQILEMYLNSVYWGQEGSGGIAGVYEAARFYFDKPIETLDIGEAALLAGIIPAPNAYSPFRNPKLARARRNAVLDDMVATGKLDTATAARERARPLAVRRGPPPPERFPSFTGYVREHLRGRLPAGAIDHWGLSILTTLDPVWQARAEETLGDAVAAHDPGGPRARPPLEGAFVAIDPTTGGVRAMVGGRASTPGGFNRAAQALRQPGSAIKPVVYAAALDGRSGGPRFTPASTVPDLRRSFDTPEGPWTPRNDEGDYHEQVTLAKALAKSLNLATANLVEAIGAGTVVRYAERFGLRGMKAVPSVGLGTGEVTLLALTSAYSTFPNRGTRRDPTPFRAVTASHGRTLLDGATRSTAVIQEPTAAVMTGLLEDVVIFGVSYPLRKHYGFTRPVGGKTGTTNDYKDAWFVGFTPDVVAGVWVGYDTPRNLQRPAAETALPVWANVMTQLLSGFPPTEFPSDHDLVLAWIDPWTGLLAGSNCPSTMRVPFLPGTAPLDFCGRDHSADWQALFDRRAADSLAAIADSIAATADSLDAPTSP